jgi:hypothetical protein
MYLSSLRRLLDIQHHLAEDCSRLPTLPPETANRVDACVGVYNMRNVGMEKLLAGINRAVHVRCEMDMRTVADPKCRHVDRRN